MAAFVGPIILLGLLGAVGLYSASKAGEKRGAAAKPVTPDESLRTALREALASLGASNGVLQPGVATPEAIQNATALASLLEKSGMTEAAKQLRELAAQAGKTVPTTPMPPGVLPASVPKEIQDTIQRAIELERDPARLHALATELRKLPMASDPKMEAMLSMLDATATQLEGQQATTAVLTQIENILKAPDVAVPTTPTGEGLPADLKSAYDAAMKPGTTDVSFIQTARTYIAAWGRQSPGNALAANNATAALDRKMLLMLGNTPRPPSLPSADPITTRMDDPPRVDPSSAIPADLQRKANDALAALGVKDGQVLGPVTQQGIAMADAASALLENAGFGSQADKLEEYASVARTMLGGGQVELLPPMAVTASAKELAAEAMVSNLKATQAKYSTVSAAKGKEDKKAVAKFQAMVSAKPDGLAGPGTLLYAAKEGVYDLPLVMYWPKGSTAATVTKYRETLVALSDKVLASGDAPGATALKASAARERGQGGIVGMPVKA